MCICSLWALTCAIARVAKDLTASGEAEAVAFCTETRAAEKREEHTHTQQRREKSVGCSRGHCRFLTKERCESAVQQKKRKEKKRKEKKKASTPSTETQNSDGKGGHRVATLMTRKTMTTGVRAAVGPMSLIVASRDKWNSVAVRL